MGEWDDWGEDAASLGMTAISGRLMGEDDPSGRNWGGWGTPHSADALAMERERNWDKSMKDVALQYRQFLGREPSQAEAEFLSKYVSAGHISAGEVGQYLQGLPEAQQARLGPQGRQLGGYLRSELGANDQEILNKAAMAARGQFASLGRPQSSGMDAMVASAGRDLALSRQNQIGNTLAQFYGGGLDRINQSYLQNAGQTIPRAYGGFDANLDFNRQLTAYQTQRKDLDEQLSTQNRQAQQGAITGGLFGIASGLAGGYGRGLGSRGG